MAHELHHFSMGMWVFFLAWLTSILGCYIGLTCARRARTAIYRQDKRRWTALASVAIGGVGVWLMHFTGMLGFEVPGAIVRYNLGLTLLSVVLAVGATWFGLTVVDADEPWMQWLPDELRLPLGSLIMGLAVGAMHYSGMAAVRVEGTLEQSLPYVLASFAIGIVASFTALWLSLNVDRRAVRFPAAALMGCAVVALHYTGMAGVSVVMDPVATMPEGMAAMTLLFPGFVVGIIVLAATVVLLMAAPSDEDLEREYAIADWMNDVR
ncbi:MHYT domain-containing protein [Rhodococcus sp. NPDC060090]|uniref:MHYT domain-containing protein n=1 Tax=Rhodococcus sp. NPDC060090 TaxID=3347056 RepID=UPI003654BB38